jgi:DNA-binding transcriptional LysR family regulator
MYFKEVASLGSITLAAESARVSPSAISRQIGKLEAAVGVPLFLRHSRGMELTEAGMLLLAHTRRAEVEGDALVQDLRASASGETRVIKVASAEGLASGRVVGAIAQLTAQFADVQFKLDVVPSAEATSRVRSGQVDIAAVFAVGPERGVTIEHSTPAPPHAVVAVGHPLSGQRSVSLLQICEHRVAIAGRGLTQRELFDIALQREGLSADVALEVDQLASVLEFARKGHGITLASHLSVPSDASHGLIFIPVADPVLSQREAQVQSMTGRRKSAVVTAFVEALVDALGERSR